MGAHRRPENADVNATNAEEPISVAVHESSSSEAILRMVDVHLACQGCALRTRSSAVGTRRRRDVLREF